MTAAHITVTVSAEDAQKIIEQYAEEVRQIVAQRDELLAALKGILRVQEFGGERVRAIHAANVAIARASTPAGTGPATGS